MSYDIKDFISFNTSSTRSGSHLKLCHPRALSTNHHHFYFNRIVRLWNHMPVIDISLPSHVIKQNLTKYLWNHFTANFNSDQSWIYHYLCPCYQCSRQPASSNFLNLITATDTTNHIITNMWITVQCMYLYYLAVDTDSPQAFKAGFPACKA